MKNIFKILEEPIDLVNGNVKSINKNKKLMVTNFVESIQLSVI